MPGYDQNRFNPSPPAHLECLVCQKIAKDPIECNVCGQIYCTDCCQGKQCISPHCGQNNTPSFQKISGALLKLYRNQNIKCCNPECNKILTIVDIEAHQTQCLKIKCVNFENCQDYASLNEPYKQKQLCGQLCQTTLELFEKKGDIKAQYEILKKFFPLMQNQSVVQQKMIPEISMIQGESIFKWDSQKSGTGIQLQGNDLHVFLRESSYIFRTIFGDKGFESGVHYWEIEADSRTENELKIGVFQGNNINFNAAFCDSQNGFAYYGLAQLRNGSNASGSTYGKRFKKEGVLGVCLNMINGTLSFSLNGEYMGIAFRSDILKRGPIYAAVALLHCAGCTLKVGKQKPSYME